MAIYHASAKIISRSGGKSILAAAAYRAGDKLTDQRLGTRFDYTKKQGVDSTIILAPENAPDWVRNREKLWNTVEAAENRKDSQLAREFNIALPVELKKEQMKDLALEYVQEQFVNRGMIADVAFHDLNSDNPHFHVLLTMRDISEQGFSLKKNRDWNSTELLVEQREAWANHVNAALKNLGLVEEKIDHRTLVAQGITDRIAQVHLGPELHRMREQSILQGNLQEFRDKYQIGDLYETINEINLELASSNAANEELNELIAIEIEAGEEIKQQITSFPSAQNKSIFPTDTDRERESSSEPINSTISLLQDFLRFQLTTEYEGDFYTLKYRRDENSTTITLQSASTGEKLFQATESDLLWMVELNSLSQVDFERFSLIRSALEKENQINRRLYLELKESVIADLEEDHYEMTPELIDLNIAYQLFSEDDLPSLESYRILMQSDHALELELPKSINYCQNLHQNVLEMRSQLELSDSIELE
ncbi:MobQ family relaxase [Chroococcus sp. FPU101]|uniref:MobQ family relaxase n=1 Tax=Chroococcus sp. FPU101 TaxID=1974212 RepID=UPI001A8FC69C|nr:MobQ family relaxase [Chroococcus sp. FPU101]